MNNQITQSLVETTQCTLCINGEVLTQIICIEHDNCEPINIWVDCDCVYNYESDY